MIGKFVFIDGGNNAEREEYETIGDRRELRNADYVL